MRQLLLAPMNCRSRGPPVFLMLACAPPASPMMLPMIPTNQAYIHSFSFLGNHLD